LIWTLGIGIFSENVRQILTEVTNRDFVRLVFQQRTLNPGAALVIFLVIGVISYFRVGKTIQSNWVKVPTAQQKQGRIVGIVLGFALLLALPWMVGQFLSQALFLVGMYVMMGLGLNIVVGYAGLLDLGYVAFFAFGAYTMGILTSTGPLGVGNFNFWTALPIAVIVGVVWGYVLGFPVLRMRGDYLAIVTLGFGEIIRILATSNWLAPFEGGPQGVLHIPNPEFFGIVMNQPQQMYYIVVAGSLLIAFVTIRLRDSRLGRQWMAMREDEDVAEAMGINLVQTKLLAFGIGAAFSALAGAVFAARVGNIFPHSFNLLISINALSLIIVGGMGSIPGVVVGALILVGLPELLREFTEYRLLMYGILLILMMLFKPEGFLPAETLKRELRGDDEPIIEEEITPSKA
jgi:branched-chain amino acid transport system permease protein